ncbi:MAG: hypothetical protein US89_C0002G0029 [Candidatus Peregrinibacteria bacterium GW2011_GWF2_38_29]|nr:MAG: hypothetical protein US89_C0002G0029 [Candidatus Peregrinibacteria bacterium GW2011_GWF2_38_29]HBB02185.1 hypothetical protein [Candidatus Peregrinibacteria bacterium]
MSKELKNITSAIMGKIHHGEIKMRSRLYYILGSLLAISGLAASIIVSVFFISLTRFMLRAHGPMGQIRLDQLISSFPWWAPIFAIISLATGLWLLRKYEFSYKRKPWMIIIGFIITILIVGIVIDMIGLDDVWLRHGPMKGIMGRFSR